MILSGWAEFARALSVFMTSHYRPRVVGRHETPNGKIGRRLSFVGYGIVSLVVLVWLIGSASRSPYVELWGASE